MKRGRTLMLPASDGERPSKMPCRPPGADAALLGTDVPPAPYIRTAGELLQEIALVSVDGDQWTIDDEFHDAASGRTWQRWRHVQDGWSWWWDPVAEEWWPRS